MRNTLSTVAVPLTIWASRRRGRRPLRRRGLAAATLAAVLALAWIAARAGDSPGTTPAAAAEQSQPVSVERPQAGIDVTEHELIERLRTRRAAFGDHSVEVAGSLALLGMRFYDRGDYGQAAAMLRHSLAIWSALPEPEPAALAFLQAHLALARCRLQHGDAAAACELGA